MRHSGPARGSIRFGTAVEGRPTTVLHQCRQQPMQLYPNDRWTGLRVDSASQQTDIFEFVIHYEFQHCRTQCSSALVVLHLNLDTAESNLFLSVVDALADDHDSNLM